MLQILRNKAQSTVIQVVVVVIALVFIFWGVGTNLGRDRQSALTINGEEVSFSDYQKAYDRAYQRVSDQFGGNLPKGLVESLNIKQQVINQLVQSALLRQGAHEMGITLSNKEIRKIIQGMVQFQKNGHFDLERYKAILAANRMAPTKFEQSMRTDRLSEVASREIANFVTVATGLELQDIYGRINEQVEVEFVHFDPEKFRGDVKIDDASLQKWFETVKDNYKSARQMKLRYLAFTDKTIGAKIEIDPARIKEYYDSHLQEFAVPEQRKARHILFTTKQGDPDSVRKAKRAKAEEILARAQKGEDFAQLAREFSEGPSKDDGGELGWFSPKDMVPPFAQAVLKLKGGQLSDIVETRFGYHIILLEGIRQATTKPIAEVQEEIRKKLQEKEAKSLSFQLANTAYEGIIGAGGLQQYSDSTPDTTIYDTDFFEQQDGPELLKSDPLYLDTAFKLNKGELSSLIKGKDGYVILFAQDIKEPVTPQLSAVRERAEKDYITYRAEEKAKQAAQTLLKKLQDGGDFTALASEGGLDISKSGLLKRNTPSSKSSFPTKLTDKIFLLSAKHPLPKEIGTVGDSFYVFSFVKRILPAMADDAAEKTLYRKNLIRIKQQQLLSAWLRHMEVNAEIMRHKNL